MKKKKKKQVGLAYALLFVSVSSGDTYVQTNFYGTGYWEAWSSNPGVAKDFVIRQLRRLCFIRSSTIHVSAYFRLFNFIFQCLFMFFYYSCRYICVFLSLFAFPSGSSKRALFSTVNLFVSFINQFFFSVTVQQNQQKQISFCVLGLTVCPLARQNRDFYEDV